MKYKWKKGGVFKWGSDYFKIIGKPFAGWGTLPEWYYPCILCTKNGKPYKFKKAFEKNTLEQDFWEVNYE